MTTLAPSYGRKLADFEPGAVFVHPWNLTLDAGFVARVQASFMDPCATYMSETAAHALGFDERPVPPLALLNLALSFSVHDVSEQAIAHLAYIDVRFPHPAYPGDTVRALSEVIGTKPSEKGDRGVVHVRTVLENQRGEVVCCFERKALVPGGKVEHRPVTPPSDEKVRVPNALFPKNLKKVAGQSHSTFPFFFEDFAPWTVFAHRAGRTVGDSEHMELTMLFRNTHPLHFDELYCQRGGSFAKTRVVYGGLVFGWIHALAGRDVGGNALWDVSFDNGAHPSGVVAGDTLYALSQVLEQRDVGKHHGEVVMRLVGVKNESAVEALEKRAGLFEPELGKPAEARIPTKVFEITRTLLVRKRDKPKAARAPVVAKTKAKKRKR